MSDKVILQHVEFKGTTWCAEEGGLLDADFASGKCYRLDYGARGTTWVQDDAGKWMAVADYRGPDAPEPAKAEPWPADAVLRDPDGRHWTDRSTFIYADGRESVAPTSAASVRRSRLIKGRHYRFVTHAGGEPLEEVAAASSTTWLCVRDFTGPAYREPARAIHGQVVGDPAEVARAIGAGPADPYTAHRISLMERGIEVQLCHDIPDDTVPAERLAYRAAHRPQVSSDFRVVTDLDDHMIPDADESMTGRLR